MRKRSISVKICAGIVCVSIAAIAPSALAVTQLIEQGALPVSSNGITTHESVASESTLLSSTELSVDEAQYSLSDCDIYVDSMWTDSDFSNPPVRVYRYDEASGEDVALVVGTDYEFAGWYSKDPETYEYISLDAAPTSDGDYYLKITGKGNYSGEEYRYVWVDDKYDIGSYELDNSNHMWLDDDALGNPPVTLYRDDSSNGRHITLTQDTEYEFAGWYTENPDTDDFDPLNANPTSEGEYYFRIEGIGNFHGTYYVFVSIEDKYSITNYDVAVYGDVWIDGDTISGLTVEVSRYDSDTEEDVTLTQDQDYQASTWYTHIDGCDYTSDASFTALPGIPTTQGEYYLKVEGLDKYHGALYEWVWVNDARDITSYGNTYVSDTLWSGANLVIPPVTVSRYDNTADEWISLEQGKDFSVEKAWYILESNGSYTALEKAPTAEGNYYLKITGLGTESSGYYGETYVRVWVRNSYDINNYGAYVAEQFWTGADLSNPLVTVSRYDSATNKQIYLVQDTDYAVENTWYKRDDTNNSFVALESAPTEAGEYYLKVTGKGDYSGECYVYADVRDRHDIANYGYGCDFWIGNDLSSPSIELSRYDSSAEKWLYLTQGTDYLVDQTWYTHIEDCDYQSDASFQAIDGTPEQAGEYYLKVTGKGDYYGTRYLCVDVNSLYDITSYGIYIDGGLYTDSDLSNPRVEVSRYDSETGEEIQLVKGTDFLVGGWYTYDYDEGEYVSLESTVPTQAGEYYLKVTGNGNYSGTRYVCVNVRNANDISSFGASVFGTLFTDSDFDNLTVSVSRHNNETGMSTRLTQGTDFVLAGWYTRSSSGFVPIDGNPTEPGVYFMKVEGCGNYTGECYAYANVKDSHDITGYNAYIYGSLFTDSDLSNPQIKLYRNDTGEDVYLTKGDDYTVGQTWYTHVEDCDYQSDASFQAIDGTPELPGEYYLKVTGNGDYYGTCYVRAHVMDAYDIDGYGAYIFETLFTDSDFSSPSVRMSRHDAVTDTTTYLKQGTDYVLAGWYSGSYGNFTPLDGSPTEAGVYFLKIEGYGDYTGECYVRAEVKDSHDISGYKAHVYRNLYVDSDLSNVTVQVFRNDKAEEINLTQGTDFQVESNWYTLKSDGSYALFGEEAPTEAGVYYLKARGIGDYTGECFIYADVKGLNDITRFSVSDDGLYIGGDLSDPSVTVSGYDSIKGEDVVLTQGADYLVKGWYTVDENKMIVSLDGLPEEAGYYWLKVYGINDYAGESYFRVSVTTSADAHVHSWGEWTLVDAPSAMGETGTAKRFCTECDETLNTTKVLYGDVCKDSEFNVKDLVMIQRYLAGTGNLNALELQIADVVDGDGVNMKDLVYLAQQLLS